MPDISRLEEETARHDREIGSSFRQDSNVSEFFEKPEALDILAPKESERKQIEVDTAREV